MTGLYGGQRGHKELKASGVPNQRLSAEGTYLRVHGMGMVIGERARRLTVRVCCMGYLWHGPQVCLCIV